jgi:hypothetical protein
MSVKMFTRPQPDESDLHQIIPKYPFCPHFSVSSGYLISIGPNQCDPSHLLLVLQELHDCGNPLRINLTVAQLVKKFLAFYRTRNSLTCSNDNAIVSSPYHHILFP